MYCTICPRCAGKLEEFYVLDPEEGSERWGTCPLCFQPRYLMTYEQSPRKKKYRRAGAGGGERAKAGRG